MCITLSHKRDEEDGMLFIVVFASCFYICWSMYHTNAPMSLLQSIHHDIHSTTTAKTIVMTTDWEYSFLAVVVVAGGVTNRNWIAFTALFIDGLCYLWWLHLDVCMYVHTLKHMFVHMSMDVHLFMRIVSCKVPPPIVSFTTFSMIVTIAKLSTLTLIFSIIICFSWSKCRTKHIDRNVILLWVAFFFCIAFHGFISDGKSQFWCSKIVW